MEVTQKCKSHIFFQSEKLILQSKLDVYVEASKKKKMSKKIIADFVTKFFSIAFITKSQFFKNVLSTSFTFIIEFCFL